MSACNINVVEPDDDRLGPSFPNALQLQSGFGHQLGTPFQNEYPFPSDISSYSSFCDSSPGFTQFPRPHLAHLATQLNSRPFDMQRDSSSYVHGDHLGGTMGADGFSTDAFESTYPPGWTLVHDAYTDPNSPSNYIGSSSPNSQGWSPLTPNTPLLTVDHSPTTSAYPSPGSLPSPGLRGTSNGDFLHLAPSPSLRSDSTPLLSDMPAGLRASPARAPAGIHMDAQVQYYTHYQVDGQVSAAQPYAQAQTPQQAREAPVDSSYIGSNGRRYQNSVAAYTPQQTSPFHSPPPHLTASRSPYPTGAFSPYLVTAPLPYPAASASPNPATAPLPSSAHGYRGTPPRVAQALEPGAIPAGLSVPGPIVPQTVYRPNTASDQRRYVDQIELEKPIQFCLQGPSQLGISLHDALTGRFNRLTGRDDTLFETRGPSISIRLVWQGYQPWSRQIPTKDFKTPPGPITRAKLAKNIAKTVQRFIEEQKSVPMSFGSDPRWRVGNGNIEVNDLSLVSLHHVSKGSWQANLCLNRPLPAHESMQ
ncbi:hypothetical protein M0805_005837 [Coniferiporia weirii]|nr:hypothetical protein M0805_005837 [Coniferiporia weirii]